MFFASKVNLVITLCKKNIKNSLTRYNFVMTIVLKPGPARRVDLGPSRPGHGTGPGGGQNPVGN